MLATLVLARVIAESGAPALPVLDDGGVLLIKRHDVVVGDGCPGNTPPSDAGVPDDAGVPPDDAGVPPDAGCEAITGDAVTLMVQPRFSEVTTGARFALLMVTPARPVVETQSAWLFDQLAEVTATRVRVHETKVADPAYGTVCDGGYDGTGCGGAYAPIEPDDPSWTPPGLGDAGLGDRDAGYTVDTIGPYEVVRAQPADRAELASWLAGLGYLTLPADLDAVTPYIARGYTVVAIRVALPATPEGQLSPIALTWPGSELRLPAALGSPAGGTPHLATVYIAGPGRFDLPDAFVPFAMQTSWGLEGFLTKNEVVLGESGDPDDDPVAIRVVGDPEEENIEDQYTEVHVPVHQYCDDQKPIGCGCGECSAGAPRFDALAVAGVLALVLRRRRRR